MYIQCYDSWADESVREQLWNLIKQGQQGFIQDRRVCMRIWIPERLVPFALLIDSSLVRKHKEDYIA